MIRIQRADDCAISLMNPRRAASARRCHDGGFVHQLPRHDRRIVAVADAGHMVRPAQQPLDVGAKRRLRTLRVAVEAILGAVGLGVAPAPPTQVLRHAPVVGPVVGQRDDQANPTGPRRREHAIEVLGGRLDRPPGPAAEVVIVACQAAASPRRLAERPDPPHPNALARGASSSSTDAAARLSGPCMSARFAPANRNGSPSSTSWLPLARTKASASVGRPAAGRSPGHRRQSGGRWLLDLMGPRARLQQQERQRAEGPRHGRGHPHRFI